MVLAYKGIDIFYTDEGSGETLVFLHGFLENSKMWDEILPSFRKQRRIICIDLPGHGSSGNFGSIHTMDMMADAVIAVLNHLSIKRSVFIGHSMGGYVALAVAAKKSHMLQKLVLLNSTWKSDTPERKQIRNRAIEAVRKNRNAFINLSIPNLFAETSRVRFRKEISKVKKEALNTSEQGITAALEGMKIRVEHTKMLKKESFETFLIIGRDDELVDPHKLVSEAQELGITPYLLDGGHMLHIENRTKVLMLLAEIVHK